MTGRLCPDHGAACTSPECGPGWRGKAYRIVGQLSREAWAAANTTRAGTRRKRHRAYVVPPLAVDLVACLGDHDQRRGEHRAKVLFLGYDATRAAERWTRDTAARRARSPGAGTGAAASAVRS